MFGKKNWPWPLDSEVEASLMAEILKEEEIPFKFVRHGEPLFGNSEVLSSGWGHIETTPEFKDRMQTLYDDFKNSDNPEPEDVDDISETK